MMDNLTKEKLDSMILNRKKGDTLFIKNYTIGNELSLINERNIEFVDCYINNIVFSQRKGVGLFTFTNCHIIDVKFNESNIIDSQFNNCNLLKVNFRKTDLTKTVFLNTKIVNCYFDDSNLKSVVFDNCNLLKVNFRKTDLTKTDFLRNQTKHKNISIDENCIIDNTNIKLKYLTLTQVFNAFKNMGMDKVDPRLWSNSIY
jgi:uncharacterized protein YjbI with pentapeptide repeats